MRGHLVKPGLGDGCQSTRVLSVSVRAPVLSRGSCWGTLGYPLPATLLPRSEDSYARRAGAWAKHWAKLSQLTLSEREHRLEDCGSCQASRSLPLTSTIPLPDAPVRDFTSACHTAPAAGDWSLQEAGAVLKESILEGEQ